MRTARMRWASSLVTSAAVILLARPALANGRFPAASQLVVSSADPSLITLRTTFGVVVSADAGKHWDWVCETAVGYGGTVEDPAMGIFGSGTIVAGTQEGLAVSPDKGCSWAFAPIGKPIVDVVVRRESPGEGLVLVSSDPAYDDAGNAHFDNAIYATKDAGAHFTRLAGAIDPALVTQTLEVAKSDPHRIYVSGTRITATSTDGVIFTSTNDGAKFTEASFPLEDGETAPFLAAVDPTDANRVYIRVKAADTSRLVVSDDGAKTFRTAYRTKGEMLGFALSPDGTKVFLGGPDDGLLAASKTDMKFAARSSVQIQCLATAGDTLYACSNETSGFVIGASADDGASFAPLLHLCSVRGPLACAAGTSAATCGSQWPAVQDLLKKKCVAADGGAIDPDAGSTPAPTGGVDAGAGAADAGNAATPSAPAGGGGGGCATTEAPPAAGGMALLALVAFGLVRRRRSATAR